MSENGRDAVYAPVMPALGIERSPHSEPFWEAARQRRLMVPRCVHCGAYSLPPKGFCPSCRRQDQRFVELSGRATLYTYTVVRHAVTPALAERVPYVLAIVKLSDAGDLKMLSNIVDCELKDIRMDQQLQVVFQDQADGVTVPRFRPVL